MAEMYLKMMSCRLAFCCLFIPVFVSANVLEPSECIQECNKNNSITNSTVMRIDPQACAKGCWKFLITKDENKKEDLESIYELCSSSCHEYYAQNSHSSLHCNLGCQYQSQIMAKQQNDTIVIHNVAPLFSIHSLRFIGDALHNAIRAVQTTWSYYVADTGDVITLKSSSEYVIVPQPHTDSDDSDPESGKPSEYTGDVDFDNYKEDSAQAKSSILKSDWLGCVSRKSGLPRSFIAFSILVSIVAIIWLCLSTIATSDKKQAKDVSLKGNLPAYVDIFGNSEKIKIQPTTGEQAEPLPVKVNLTHV